MRYAVIIETDVGILQLAEALSLASVELRAVTGDFTVESIQAMVQRIAEADAAPNQGQFGTGSQHESRNNDAQA